jgi:hypothetical protein
MLGASSALTVMMSGVGSMPLVQPDVARGPGVIVMAHVALLGRTDPQVAADIAMASDGLVEDTDTLVACMSPMLVTKKVRCVPFTASASCTGLAISAV